MLRALAHRNYRLYFVGQGVSLIGTWMTRIALSWLVYRLTGSELLLGVVGFAGQLPAFLCAPFAGVLVDRWNRHRLLVITQMLSIVQASTLAMLTLTGQISVAQIVVLSIVQGVINAFDMPARQAFLVQMVESRADLPNAIALNSSMVNGARLLGPSLGGVIVALVGEGWCFLIDSVSYLAVVASLLAMRIATTSPTIGQGRMLSQLGEGWLYAWRFAPIRKLLVLLAIVSLIGMPYAVLMPVFADRYLGGGPYLLGVLMAASGLGALTGALLLAARRSVLGLGRLVPLATAGFGAALIAFSASRVPWVSVLLMIVSGLCFMVQLAASNTLLQTIVEDDKRGRLMSLYTMSFMGTLPFGSLLAGVAADRIGAPLTLACGGAGCLVAAGWFARSLPALRREVTPVYVQRGILPEIATGLEQAAELSTPPES